MFLERNHFPLSNFMESFSNFQAFVSLEQLQWGEQIGYHCRCLDPAARLQLVMMLRVSNPRWLMQEATQKCTVYPGSGRGAVRPARVCECTI